MKFPILKAILCAVVAVSGCALYDNNRRRSVERAFELGVCAGKTNSEKQARAIMWLRNEFVFPGTTEGHARGCEVLAL